MKLNYERHIPTVVSAYKPLFAPQKYGNYVNDHSLIRAADGFWHLFGITGFASDPNQERYFVHARAERLWQEEGMDELGKVIDNGGKAWAPCVVGQQDKYYMLYGPSPTKLAVSVDLAEWMVYPPKMRGEPPLGAHRDHMAIKINADTWVMYLSGIRNGYSCISCFVSNDLVEWRFVQYALTSSGNAPLNPAWGAFESPYVVRYGDLYYLFTTYTNCDNANYHDTLVFASPNPYDFGDYTGDNHAETVVAKLHAHAGEVLYDPDTDGWYITSAGWRDKNVPIEGAVAIARLEWRPER